MKRSRRHCRGGTALLTVMFVIATASALLATVAAVSLQRSFSAQKLAERVIATAIAEAGIDQAYSLLATNFSQRTNAAAFPPTSYGGGMYDVEVTPLGNSVAVLCSTGIYKSAVVEVMADIKNYGTGSSWTEENDPFNYAILVGGGGMEWKGNGAITVTGAPVHSNGRLFINGDGNVNGNASSSVEIRTVGNAKINGNATAPAFSGKSPGNVTGTATQKTVPPVTIPDIDLTPFYNEALKNGEVYNGNVTITGGTPLRPNGGIMWVNGNLRISSTFDMLGCFIATGDIIITGHGNHKKVGNYPALVSRDGKIDLSGNGSFHGLIYAKNGGFEKTGAGPVVGTIMAGSYFKKGGGWSLMSYEDSTPTGPDGGSLFGDVIGVSAWQK